eukprot:1063493-Amphidinium_carterae.1
MTSASGPGMVPLDEPMVSEDPFWDEDEEEITKVEEVLQDKRNALAAKRRQIGVSNTTSFGRALHVAQDQ